MNKILEIIYKAYASMPADVCPLETPETFEAYCDFTDTYLGDNMSYDESSEAQEHFASLISSYQLKAFEAGFKTAVQLLMGGGQA